MLKSITSNKKEKSFSREDYDKQIETILESDTGARRLDGKLGYIVTLITFLWSAFQIWVASPVQYMVYPIDSTAVRMIHLAFALILTYLLYPAFKFSPRHKLPVIDIILLFLSMSSILYLLYNYNNLAHQLGRVDEIHIILGACGIGLLLEAARRSLGLPMTIMATIVLLYPAVREYLPDILSGNNKSITKIVEHQWISPEGVFGVPLGVSSSFVFLYVLLGAFLEKAGAGNFFIKMSFALLGHLKGGPAKAAVVASGLMGMISGSSISNTVTVGTFTIPLMKRVGFNPNKAGAIEVSAGINGQIMPPVMGAAAFLMTEFIGIPYTEVIKHAFLPAIMTYIALLYMVHLEALKLNMKSIKKEVTGTFYHRCLGYGIVITSLIIVCGLIWGGIHIIKTGLESMELIGLTSTIFALVFFGVYFFILRYSAKFNDLEEGDPDQEDIKLPNALEVFRTGIHYLLPIVVLIWCLMVEKFSPGLSAYWAILSMIIIVVTQKPLKAYLRKTAKSMNDLKPYLKEGVSDFVEGMTTGARNMIGIGIATAAAGMIVGAVTLTGIGQVMTDLVETLSGGNLVLSLVYTAIICIILGMGMPTTACYIVVSTLMAPVITNIAAQNGIEIPLIAIHLFVFYFGLMADVTPPVGLASYAASAISRGDPIKTGIQGFLYNTRTMLLPFIFLFNTKLLLIGTDGIFDIITVIIVSIIGIMIASAVIQGYFLVKSRIWETAILALVSLMLLYPKYIIDKIIPPYKFIDMNNFNEEIGKINNNQIRLHVDGWDNYGDESSFIFVIPITEGTVEEKIKNTGMVLKKVENGYIIDDIVFQGIAEKAGLDYDFIIRDIETPLKQFDENIIIVSGFILLGLIFVLQRRRRDSQA